jgi:hypothetical protein
MFSVNCFSCSVRLIKAIQWLATTGSDLCLTGLDLGAVVFSFLEIDYVPRFSEKRKFSYVPRFSVERNLLCSLMSRGREI